jgi:hypothetical protein
MRCVKLAAVLERCLIEVQVGPLIEFRTEQRVIHDGRKLYASVEYSGRVGRINHQSRDAEEHNQRTESVDG